MFVLFIILLVIFMLKSNNLLLSLLVLEIISFFSLALFSIEMSSIVFSDFLVVILFSVFVMEGVIGLSGLISLVSNTGSDYVSSRSLSFW